MSDELISAALSSEGIHVVRLLGRGGYARVFLVNWDNYPNEEFVAKVIQLPRKYIEKARSSYVNEIISLSQLYHKHIIQIYKHFIIGELMVIIMEYCHNGTVKDAIKQNGPIQNDSFRHFAKECLEAVKFCHQNGIAHRDIKPANLLFDRNGRIKLCDFGLADPKNSDLVSRREGSLAFVPPEFFKKNAYDPKKADIWSLGITFYFIVTGTLPFELGSYDEIKTQILVKGLSFPSNIPANIQYFISKMARKIPEERPTADHLLNSSFFDVLPALSKVHKIRATMSNFDETNRIAGFSTLAKLQISKGYTSRINLNNYKRKSLNIKF